jgi:hypothetical protein
MGVDSAFGPADRAELEVLLTNRNTPRKLV